MSCVSSTDVEVDDISVVSVRHFVRDSERVFSCWPLTHLQLSSDGRVYAGRIMPRARCGCQGR